tara:strand:+ start:240 stop:662 length:423 start_codon:yes stop_codon:yes gene_type:complete
MSINQITQENVAKTLCAMRTIAAKKNSLSPTKATDSSAKFFKVNPETQNIEPISKEEAIKLSKEPPVIDWNGDFTSEVKAVLKQGCENKIWGLFFSPEYSPRKTWRGWHDLFVSHDFGNTVMVELMKKAETETLKKKEAL